MTYVDQDLRVNNGESVRESDPDYSSAIDLTLSPDMGAGNQLVAIIVIDEYTVGSNTAVTFNIVTSAAEALTSPRVIGSKTLTTAQLEARDDDANRQPIVIRCNPDHEAADLVSGVTERYLGIEYDHATTPTVLKVTAYFVLDYQGDPAHSHHASGSVIA